jgi:uncharacterized protein (TIGR03437 family)
MFRLLFACFFVSICTLSLPEAQAAALTCLPTTTPTVIHGEGITERTGDIVFDCTGGIADATITANLFLFPNVSITNRLLPDNSGNFTGVTLTADNGSGPQPVGVPATQAGSAALVFNGAMFTLSGQGAVTLRVAGLRGAANELNFAPNSTLKVLIGLNPQTVLGLANNILTVGIPEHGLYDGFASTIVCNQKGSPLPADIGSFASFIASGATFASTRVTEGYADSFGPLGATQNIDADTGTRIIVQYSGFPAGARLFVPTVVAGSDATRPTAGGDLGVSASGGQYTPGPNPSLLLSFVPNADATGAHGKPLYTPGAPGSGTVSFDGMSEVILTNGAGVAVYEVVDANDHIQESAQFPTFLSLAPFSGDSVTTAETVSLAPISTVYVATAKDPIPRFQQIDIPEDCTLLGDCHAKYFPQLLVLEPSLTFTAEAGSQTQTQNVIIQNSSGGVLSWKASLKYIDGSGWLNPSPLSGVNNSGIRVDAIPGTLAVGTYHAILTIDGGPLAGSKDVPISLTITAAGPPPPPKPNVTALVNAATFASGAVAPGSIASLGGTHLSGKNVVVTFNGTPATTLFLGDTQINLIVPAGIVGSTATVVVTADGVASPPFTVDLTEWAPGIFQGGVLNQDYSVNSSAKPAALGSIIQIFATGLSGNGVIIAKIGSETITNPYYGGPAPGLTGVDQVDLILPADLTGSTANVSVCGGPVIRLAVCSPPVAVAISH